MAGVEKQSCQAVTNLATGFVLPCGVASSCIGALGPSVRLTGAASSADQMPSFILHLLSFDSGLD